MILIKDKLKRKAYLETELAHRGFWDGWCIGGMEKELKQINIQIQEFNRKDV